jgi:hypothetical protein
MRGALAAVGAVITVSVIAGGIFAASFGGSAAAGDAVDVKAAPTEPAIVLAGRWSGEHYGYGRAGVGKGNCAETGCSLTYDIVACKEGWCGIAVNDDKSCGAVGVRLTADAERQGTDEKAFKGKLELTKGAAPYAVEAWFRNDDDKPTMRLLGDTGGELLLYRRSYPLEANFERIGEAICTLDKATS